MTDHTPLNSSESTYAVLSDVSEKSIKLTPPWYYQALIKLSKPLYRGLLWHRYQKAKKSNIQTADFQTEMNQRFGKQYPEVPIFVDTLSFESHASLVQPPSAADQPSIGDKSGLSEALDIGHDLDAPSNDFDKVSANVLCNALIWCHAVSLGETNTIAPMLKHMLAQGARIWMTNTTQTGFARSETVFREALDSRQMVHSFVPVDDNSVIKKFVSHVNPDLAMFVETELWANALAELNRSGIPSVLVNARLSQKSFVSYAKYPRVSTSMMHNITMIIAQDTDSAKRFRQLGTPVAKIRRAESLKWSPIDGNSQLNNQHSSGVESNNKDIELKFARPISALNRPIWVAGSTHEGEEALALQAHKQLIDKQGLAKTLLIIVPRHPERFDRVAEHLAASGMRVARRSQGELIDDSTQVYLADTMGELNSCYALSDVAVVGGSLVDIGGHNPIEAATLGKPIVMGTYTQSCHELVSALSQVGALKVVEAQSIHRQQDSQQQSKQVSALVDIMQAWLLNPGQAQHAGEKGRQLVIEKSQAMYNQLAMIKSLLVEYKAPTAVPHQDEKIVDFDHFEVRTRTQGE